MVPSCILRVCLLTSSLLSLSHLSPHLYYTTTHYTTTQLHHSLPYRLIANFHADNAAVIVNAKGEMKGSTITGPVAKECADLWPRVSSATGMQRVVVVVVVLRGAGVIGPWLL